MPAVQHVEAAVGQDDPLALGTVRLHLYGKFLRTERCVREALQMPAELDGAADRCSGLVHHHIRGCLRQVEAGGQREAHWPGPGGLSAAAELEAGH